MHGTLVYPHPGQPRLSGSSRGFQRMPRNSKLTPGLRQRISMWKRLLLAELLRRVRIRPQ
jgi:hypothetical protein